MARLLACPFCRELYPDDEQKTCPECGVALKPMEQLPPSLDALHEEAEEGFITAPEDRRLPFAYLGRGRGLLVLLAVLGLAAFFTPWVVLHRPEQVVYRGFDMARGRAGWLWGGAVGWFILIPLVLSRRTIYAMRGVRIVCALFAAMTLGEAIMLMAIPPRSSSPYVTFDFSWGWGLYASAIVSAIGVIVAARFGGRLDDIPALPWEDDRGKLHEESSRGETLH